MSSGSADKRRHTSTRDLLEMKRRGEKIVALTAYDYLFAKLVDEGGSDVVLVGDSLGQVVLGYDSTIPVTLDDMIHHARAVRRGVKHALVVVDMPFGTFQVSIDDTLRNGSHLFKESGCEALKIEGGDARTAEMAAALINAGIPVMGHIGLTPQSVHALGGYRVQGREAEEATRLIKDAKRLEAAGCFSVVLELMPANLAQQVSKAISIPTIGIGAGGGCDGQVLVLYDMLGLNDGFKPRFLKRFGNLAEDTRNAVAQYVAAVRDGSYPAEEHSFE